MKLPLEELACLYVLDLLEPAERVAFEARLPEDAKLTTLVRELEWTLARSVHSLPEHVPPVGLLARIEAGIARLPTEAAGAAPAPRWRFFARWSVAAAIALALGAIAAWDWRRPSPEGGRPLVVVAGFGAWRSTLTELPMRKHPLDADDRFIQLASLAEEYWENPEELPVKLSADSPNSGGYAVFDPGSNQGFVGIRQLPPLGASTSYCLWILDTGSGRVRAAGILPHSAASRGLYFFSISAKDEPKPGHIGFFVTAEESDRTDAILPHGRVVLGDKGS